jgi:hypothetical protein
VKSEVGKRMRVVDESKEGEWSWGRELDGAFGNLSPGRRGVLAVAVNLWRRANDWYR